MAEQYGKWKVVESLGEGGQGHTFRAVKLLEDGAESKEAYVLKRLKTLDQARCFEDEISACQQLSHPNILKIVDYDLEGPKPYLVSEFCPGGSLGDIDVNTYTMAERLTMFSNICHAVGNAHSNKPRIIHRDLKPKNIFLREDRRSPVVGDFGICFIDDDSEIRSEAEVNAAGGSRSGISRFLYGRVLRNGSGLCSQRQGRHPPRCSSFRAAVVARRSSAN